MVGFRQRLMNSPARYRCVVCGGMLVVFHLCPGCCQPVHPACMAMCHELPVQQEQQVLVITEPLLSQR